MTLGWWAVTPRSLRQFNNPEDLLANERGGWDDHTLAWVYVRALSQAAVEVRAEIRRKDRLVRLLAAGALLHGLALALCAVVWID